jgi:hypothetical protein
MLSCKAGKQIKQIQPARLIAAAVQSSFRQRTHRYESKQYDPDLAPAEPAGTTGRGSRSGPKRNAPRQGRPWRIQQIYRLKGKSRGKL